MKFSTSTKVICGLVAAAALIYGILIVYSLMPHPAVQPHRGIDLHATFGPTSGTVVEYSKSSNSVFVAGEISSLTEKRLAKTLQDQPGAEYLVLRSRKGDKATAERISALVRSTGIKTLVVDYCHGVCATIFMSAQNKFLSQRAAPLMLGIHADTGDFHKLETEMDMVAREPRLSARMLEEIAREFAVGLKRPVDIKVISSPEDFHSAAWLREASKHATDGEYWMPRGYFDARGHKARVVAGLNNSPDDARKTLAHEVYGHAALAHWAQDGHDVVGILRGIAHGRPDLVQERAKIYGYTPAQDIWSAEEVLARVAENQPELSRLDAALASHRFWLREKVFPGLYLSDREIIWGYVARMRLSML